MQIPGRLAVPSRARASGFTLIELLVAVAIIALLIAILIPSLSRARESARTAHCASGLRQWGIAFAYYMNDYDQFLPQEGNASSAAGVTDNAAWYNALPVYVNAPRYYYIYAGINARVGTTVTDDNGYTWTIGSPNPDSGYKNAWIWYCQQKLLRQKNSNSSLNSFNYTFNGLLDGAGNSGTWGGDAGARHTKTTSIDELASTLVLFEPTGNNPSDVPATSTTGPTPNNVDSRRHSSASASNILTLDIHVETVKATEFKTPARTSTTDTWKQNDPRLIWGPFPSF